MSSNRKIILASQSKVRRGVLEQLGLDFEVQESAYEEDMSLDKSPEDLAKFLSLEKAKDVASDYEDAIIVAGDTFIIHKGEVMGKPTDVTGGVKMLQEFSGKKIKVISGLAIIDTKNDKIINDYGIGFVNFRKFTNDEIEKYAATPESLRSAGAFAIAGLGAVLVDSLEGDIYSINTIPLVKRYLGLKQLGVDVLGVNN
jgi:septum formation protein